MDSSTALWGGFRGALQRADPEVVRRQLILQRQQSSTDSLFDFSLETEVAELRLQQRDGLTLTASELERIAGGNPIVVGNHLLHTAIVALVAVVCSGGPVSWVAAAVGAVRVPPAAGGGVSMVARRPG